MHLSNLAWLKFTFDSVWPWCSYALVSNLRPGNVLRWKNVKTIAGAQKSPEPAPSMATRHATSHPARATQHVATVVTWFWTLALGTGSHISGRNFKEYSDILISVSPNTHWINDRHSHLRCQKATYLKCLRLGLINHHSNVIFVRADHFLKYVLNCAPLLLGYNHLRGHETPLQIHMLVLASVVSIQKHKSKACHVSATTAVHFGSHPFDFQSINLG